MSRIESLPTVASQQTAAVTTCPSETLSQGAIENRIMELFKKLAALFSLIEDMHSKVDENRVSSIHFSFQQKIDTIRWQAGVQLGTAIAGGLCSTGSGFAPSLLGKCTNWSQSTLDSIGKTADGLGKAIPQFGQMGTTYLEGSKVGHDCDITVKQHKLDRIGVLRKSIETALQKEVFDTIKEINSLFFKLFHPAR